MEKKFVDANNTCTGGATTTNKNNVIPTSRSWGCNGGGG
jgi:hypothetical protein